jgi:hypothetical protein
MLNIPIIKLKRLIETLFEWVKTDYETNLAATTEEESFLYRMLSGYTDANYKFYEQSVGVFTKTAESPRKLAVKLMFPKQIQGVPSIYVREPARQKGNSDSLGMGIGGSSFYLGTDGTTSDNLRQSVSAMFEIVVVIVPDPPPYE